MKIVITGQKSFGRAVMKRLIEDGHEILGVAVAPQQVKRIRWSGWLCGTTYRYWLMPKN